MYINMSDLTVYPVKSLDINDDAKDLDPTFNLSN